jgi:hypothetical protein
MLQRQWTMLTSAGKSLKPKVTFFSSAALSAWLKTTVSGLTWMPLGSRPVPLDWMNVMRCFIVVMLCCVPAGNQENSFQK